MGLLCVNKPQKEKHESIQERSGTRGICRDKSSVTKSQKKVTTLIGKKKTQKRNINTPKPLNFNQWLVTGLVPTETRERTTKGCQTTENKSIQNTGIKIVKKKYLLSKKTTKNPTTTHQTSTEPRHYLSFTINKTSSSIKNTCAPKQQQ